MSTTEHAVEVITKVCGSKMIMPYDDCMGIVRCPVCPPGPSGSFTHPVSVKINPLGPNKGMGIIDKNGITVDRETEPYGRGVTISINFGCEGCSSFFEWNFRFHKGQTFVDIERSSGEWEDIFEAIWRD